MYRLEDGPIETIHLYVVPEREYKPFTYKHALNSVLCAIFLLCLLPLSSDMDIVEKTIIVPLQFMPPQIFTTTATITPTGNTIVPATMAYGTLTLYNGSILTQVLPKGFIVTTASGIEIITTDAVTIPAGNPPLYGTSLVSAKAVSSGSSGNIPTLAINQSYGTSLFMKNLTAFMGGTDSYIVKFVTSNDKIKAITTARATVQAKERSYKEILNNPCTETMVQYALSLSISLRCQFVRYTAPMGMQVTSMRRVGNYILLQVKIVVR